MKLQTDLKEFVALLISHKVEFVVVGGHAVAFHGHARFTGDIDFLVRASDENAKRILDVLSAFGFGGLRLNVSDFTRAEAVVQLGRPPNRIDLLTSISGISFDDAWAGRIAGELDGLSVFYLGLDALLKNKIASGRDKDLADVKQLKAIATKSK